MLIGSNSKSFEKISSRYQCGFYKGYNPQHYLLAMIEKWKKNVDNGGVLGTLLIDLSKTFDCILYDRIIVRLESYGFHIDALKLIDDYLSNRKQSVKVNDAYSLWCPTVIHIRTFMCVCAASV